MSQEEVFVDLPIDDTSTRRKEKPLSMDEYIYIDCEL